MSATSGTFKAGETFKADNHKYQVYSSVLYELARRRHAVAVYKFYTAVVHELTARRCLK